MTRRQAIEAVTPIVEDKLTRRLTVFVGDRSWRIPVSELGMAADPEAAVDRALRLSAKMSWLSRVYHRVSKTPVDRRFWVEYSLDVAPIRALVDRISEQVAVPALSTFEGLADNNVAMARVRPGQALRTWMAKRLLERAVADGGGRVVLPMETVDPDVTALVERVSDEVAVSPSGAYYDLVDDKVVMVHAQPGRELRTRVARALLEKAVREGGGRVGLPTRAVQPDAADRDAGDLIVVDRTTNTLRFYDDFKVIRKYDVATASYGYVTPPGEWSIYNKVENPTWYNGAQDTWGKDLPDIIPPGPGNPLGTRALYVDAPGIRIHGTYDTDSVGTYASHGCIRMRIKESEALYPLVDIGTPVFVVGAPPWGNFEFPDSEVGV
jgi:lipoprotein-anchoring transpeptidase ErfK/SrfK